MSAAREVVVALRDNSTGPSRDILQAVLDLIDNPGPSNNLAWAFVAFDEHAVATYLASPEAQAVLADALHEARVGCVSAEHGNPCTDTYSNDEIHEIAAIDILAAMRAEASE